MAWAGRACGGTGLRGEGSQRCHPGPRFPFLRATCTGHSPVVGGDLADCPVPFPAGPGEGGLCGHLRACVRARACAYPCMRVCARLRACARVSVSVCMCVCTCVWWEGFLVSVCVPLVKVRRQRSVGRGRDGYIPDSPDWSPPLAAGRSASAPPVCSLPLPPESALPPRFAHAGTGGTPG